MPCSLMIEIQKPCRAQASRCQSAFVRPFKIERISI